MKNTLIRLLVLALLASGTLNLMAYSKSDPLEQLNTDFHGRKYLAASVDQYNTLTITLRTVPENPMESSTNHNIYIADVDVETDITSD
ncbi:MAG TPA: hypothetical protein VGO50_03640 [Pyrinomonadaceae bacterium]|jgi:hypothetical protein|nr:hypothetical protein [Pyrinomonadaceae bacterium]